ncbi:MAG: GDP-mannose 4,6-dehydratase [Bacteroidetes bacterium]|nr:GDP-mannose 4,6-dehydratase [Bacteroidota bacterium]
MKTAFISGISGQDGAYLAQLLLDKGYKVIGGDRRTASGSLWRLEKLNIMNEVEIVDFELAEFTNIMRILEKNDIQEFYNLAAQSFVGASFEMPIMTADITGVSVLRILESIRKINPKIKFYQASTSEMFGKVRETPQNELTPFYPRSPYGISKLFAHWMTINYRESYNLFACSGILFNHESPLRGDEFVTKKVTMGLSKIKLGKQEILELGNLDAKRDWGFAGDYVKAMWLMLQQQNADDYVIATGETHSVKDFINLTAKQIGINLVWEGEKEKIVGIDKEKNKIIIKVNEKFYRPSEVDFLLGDSIKARKILGWEPNVTFEELVGLMTKADYDKLSKE